MHHAPAAPGCGQAAGLPGTVWQRVPVPEVRVCAGAAAELREAAQGVLPGMQGALRQHGAVYDERHGRADLS